MAVVLREVMSLGHLEKVLGTATESQEVSIHVVIAAHLSPEVMMSI
jgi:hypothetical protein